jgi:two-component system sensor histidine kinase DesK
LAVAAERERIGRDLHDILGHSLTAISIKSGLAARLAETDPAAARAQMAEVEQIARVALSDVRATASGLREVRLATELASARSVLLAAGVESVAPSAVPALSVSDSELLGYAVREAVTNVVRHAEATRVVITIENRSVAICDDGIGMPAGRTSGSGLNGLRRRFADAGGVLSISPAQLHGTVVRAQLATAPVPEVVEGREPAAVPELVERPELHHAEGRLA